MRTCYPYANRPPSYKTLEKICELLAQEISNSYNIEVKINYIQGSEQSFYRLRGVFCRTIFGIPIYRYSDTIFSAHIMEWSRHGYKDIISFNSYAHWLPNHMRHAFKKTIKRELRRFAGKRFDLHGQ